MMVLPRAAMGRLTAAHPREIAIRDLLEWTFRSEKAVLEFDQIAATSGERPGISPEWRLMQNKLIGCEIDGGGRSDPHVDAEVVAATVAVLPDAFGGSRMALTIAELARSGREPDWRADGAMRCEPREWRRCKHGLRAKVQKMPIRTYWHRGALRSYTPEVCPIVYRNTPDAVAAMRRAYLAWRGALMEIAYNLRSTRALTCHRLTDALPPVSPWAKGS